MKKNVFLPSLCAQLVKFFSQPLKVIMYLLMCSASFALVHAATDSAPLKVVTSFSILADVAKNIGQDKVQVSTLVRVNQDAHTFEPSPQDFIQLTHADIFIMNGLAFEGWIDRAVDASGFKGILVIASNGTKVITLDAKEDHDDEHDQKHDQEHGAAHAQDHKAHDTKGQVQHEDHKDHEDHEDHGRHEEHKDHENHEHGGDDPHVWQDPKNVIIFAQNIAKALIKKDPNNQAFYEANLEEYTKALKALDVWAHDEFSKVDHANRTVLMRHDAFSYMAKAYDFHILPILGISPSKDPSAKEIIELGRLIKAKNIKVAFSENIGNDRVLIALRKDFGIQEGGTLLSDALTQKEGLGATYILMFQHNVNTIVNGIKASVQK